MDPKADRSWLRGTEWPGPLQPRQGQDSAGNDHRGETRSPTGPDTSQSPLTLSVLKPPGPQRPPTVPRPRTTPRAPRPVGSTEGGHRDKGTGRSALGTAGLDSGTRRPGRPEGPLSPQSGGPALARARARDPNVRDPRARGRLER